MPPRIPLSSIINSENALTAIVEHLKNIRRQNIHDASGVKFERRLYINDDNELLFNLILGYLEGHEIHWQHNFNSVFNERENFQIPKEHHEKIISSLIENDLRNDEELLQLDFYHPYWKLTDPEQIFNLLREIIFRLAQQNEILRNTSLNNFDFIIQKEGQFLRVIPSASNSNDNVDNLSLRMATNMIESTKFRDNFNNIIKIFVNSDEATHLYNRHLSKHRANHKENSPNVSVIGLGPSGIFAAIAAYDKGANVSAIERRESYTRNNIFRLSPSIFQELIRLFVDSEDEIINLSPNHPLKYAIENGIISARTPSNFGDFFAITIKDLENLTNVCLEVIAKHEEKNQYNPSKCRIFRGFEYVSNSLNSMEKQISIKKTSTPNGNNQIHISTDLLIGADGYNSKVRNDSKIALKNLSTQVPYATFTYHPTRSPQFPHQSTLMAHQPRRNIDIAKLRNLGWEFDRQPVIRFFNTSENPYLGVEISNERAQEYKAMSEQINNLIENKRFDEAYLLKILRTTQMESWGNLLLEAFFTEEQIEQLVLKDTAIIDVKMQQAENAFIKNTHNEMDIILIGDAHQSAHFQTGSGAIAGIAEATEIGKYIESITRNDRPPIENAKELNNNIKFISTQLSSFAFNFVTGEDLRVQPLEEQKPLYNLIYSELPLSFRVFLSTATKTERQTHRGLTAENYWDNSPHPIRKSYAEQYLSQDNEHSINDHSDVGRNVLHYFSRATTSQPMPESRPKIAYGSLSIEFKQFISVRTKNDRRLSGMDLESYWNSLKLTEQENLILESSPPRKESRLN